MKNFKLEVNQAGLGLIVKHLNKGVYEEVAELLSTLHAQVQKQLPKQQFQQMPNNTVNSPKNNGASRYAKEP